MEGWQSEKQPYPWHKAGAPLTDAQKAEQAQPDPAQAGDPLSGWLIVPDGQITVG